MSSREGFALQNAWWAAIAVIKLYCSLDILEEKKKNMFNFSLQHTPMLPKGPSLPLFPARGGASSAALCHTTHQWWLMWWHCCPTPHKIIREGRHDLVSPPRDLNFSHTTHTMDWIHFTIRQLPSPHGVHG